MKYLTTLTAVVFFILIQVSVQAQCAMCKATAESNPNIGGGLNAGIEYILIVPYLLLGAFVFFVLKGKMKPFWRDLTVKSKNNNQDYSAENWY